MVGRINFFTGPMQESKRVMRCGGLQLSSRQAGSKAPRSPPNRDPLPSCCRGDVKEAAGAAGRGELLEELLILLLFGVGEARSRDLRHEQHKSPKI